jgi:predicted nucleic-acid-binding Zn-ribbon protein
MAKRKYTRFGEKAVMDECSNKKCKWQGTKKEKILVKNNEIFSTYTCPKCGNDTFFGLLELPKPSTNE